jgi:hypothetical protein
MGFFKKLHRGVRKFHRITGDPGGAVVNKVVNKSWDRPGNARSAVAPFMPTLVEEEAPVVPMPDEEDIRRAKRRSTASQLQRSGRSSTILSNANGLGP